MKEKFDTLKCLSESIMMRLAEGDIPWHRRWFESSNAKLNYVSRNEYRGVNLLLLKEPGEYMTLNQCNSAGGRIRKGETGTKILKWVPYIPSKKKKEAEELEKMGLSTKHLERLSAGYITLFHISQTTGITSKCETTEHSQAQNPTDVANYLLAYYQNHNGLKINERRNAAPALNNGSIEIPERKQFTHEESWYNTLFSLIAEKEMSKENDGASGENSGPTEKNAKTRELYNKLTKEIAGCMITTGVGLNIVQTEEETAAECNRWIGQMKMDYRLIIDASSRAVNIARKVLEPVSFMVA